MVLKIYTLPAVGTKNAGGMGLQPRWLSEGGKAVASLVTYLWIRDVKILKWEPC
jgi:hypothetical protein